MFKQMVKILMSDNNIISKAERMMVWLLRYDVKVKRASEARRVYGLWNGVLANINQAFFGEWADVDDKWASEILREIYFLVCAVDQTKSARFVKIGVRK